MSTSAKLESGSRGRGGSGGKGGRATVARRLLLLATLVTVALWWVPESNVVLYPIRLFVTFVHESGHATMALATGGMVDWMRVHADGSGVTETRGGIPLLVISGGYVGSTLFGALLLQIGRISRSANWGKITLWALAIYVVTITLLWAHTPWTDAFTPGAGIGLAIVLALLARFMPARGAAFVVSFLAVQCCLNAATDLIVLLFLTSHHIGDNDAVFMSQAYPLGPPPIVWCVVWIIVSLAVLGLSLRGLWSDRAGSRSRTSPA
jgi:hypothetical protein